MGFEGWTVLFTLEKALFALLPADILLVSHPFAEFKRIKLFSLVDHRTFLSFD